MGTDGACSLLFCAAKRIGTFPPKMPSGLRAWLGITEPLGAFRSNYGKLRRFCVSFVITKKIITKKRSLSVKKKNVSSLGAQEITP
jgi:hypothetical protein